MKPFILIISFLFATATISFAQNTVTDRHPFSIIYTIDYSTGQQTPVNFDAAILFKDAFIDLVMNTDAARYHSGSGMAGRKNFVITQLDPQVNGNAYELELQNKYFNQTTRIYTFIYDVDKNALTFFDVRSQSYVPVPVQGYNLNNLNNCYTYGNFNAPNTTQAAIDPATADAPVDVNVTATTTPPPMPDYQQPECPTDGYLWQPGYWAFSPNGGGYYWVPGAWVAPPQTGLLWTPPYWGFVRGVYVFNAGYWGPTVGFYGGISYGYGYSGRGYYGGDWREGHFRYNTAVVRVNTVVVHNTYIDNTVIVNNTQVNRSSFNGTGGVTATPNAREIAATHETHVMATPEQNRNQQLARADKSQFVSANGGKPANLARQKAPAREEVVNAELKARATAPGAGKPVAPGRVGSRPAAPAAPGAKPGAPAVQGATPTGPAGPGAKPGAPLTPRAAPTGPGGAGVKPGAPATPGAAPTGPGGAGGKPGTPGAPSAPGTKPGTPAKPGASQGTGTKSGTRGGHGTKQGKQKTNQKNDHDQKDAPPTKS